MTGATGKMAESDAVISMGSPGQATEVTLAGTSGGGAARGTLRTRALRGSVWALGSFAFGNVLRLGSNLVLAHVLFPEAFAMVAIASIVLQGLQMFSDIGIGPAIVHSPRSDEEAFLNTAWTIQVIRGCFLWMTTLAIAYPVAQLYSTPEMQWLVPACGLSFVATGFQSTKVSMCSRELDLGLPTLMGLGESLVRTVVTVVWALIWPSVWAIVWGSFISYLLHSIATHLLLPGRRNRFSWDKDAVRELTQFGRWVFLSTALTFFAMQCDRLILGKLVPLDVLGVYSIAYMFSKLPADIGGRLTSPVQFPALAEVFRRDPARFGSSLIESRRLILSVCQFGVVCIIVGSPWFFVFLYDERYSNAGVLAPLLALTVWISVLQKSADRALLAIGDARSLAFSNAANCIVTLTACIAGHRLAGMPGFIAGVGLGNLSGHLVVSLSLSLHGFRILRQDLLYSGLVASVATITIGLPAVLPAWFSSPVPHIVLGLSGLSVSGSCLWRILGPTLVNAVLPFLRGDRAGIVGNSPS